MAFVSTPGLELPGSRFLNGVNIGFSFGTRALDASGEKYSIILPAPKAGAIRRIGIYFGTVTTPTDTDVRIETVSGRAPTGTLWGTTTNGTIASADVDSNTFRYASLTADASVDEDDVFAVVIAPSGTPNFQVRHCSFPGTLLPYNNVFDTAWIGTTNNTPILAVEYSDGSYYEIPGILPLTAFNTHSAFSSGATPDERALKFKVPAAIRVGGFWLLIDMDEALDVVLYDSDGATPLLTRALTNNTRSTTSNGVIWARFASKADLLADTFYYLSVKPGASSIVTYSYDVPSAAVFDQIAGGQNFHYAERTDAGAWSPTTTRRPLMGLIIDGIADGAAGGGSGGGRYYGGGY